MSEQSTTPGTGLQVSVEQPSSFERRLSVTVPPERVRRIRQSVAAHITRNVRLPGFRKGKLPENLVQKQFGQAIEQETVDRVIQETYREALDQEGIRPINQGAVTDVHYHGEGGELHYHVDVEVQPTIELARTGGFVVARPSDEVKPEEVDAILERLRADRATFQVVDDRKPDYGDEVQVRITAPAGGEGVEPEPEEYRFALGEGQAIPPIEEAIMSLMPGEEGEFDITFPEDFGDPAQAGTTQHMKIGVVELRRREFPELDDEFARSLGAGEFDTLAALRERITADLQGEARSRSEQAYRDTLLDQVVEANAVEAPRSMVDNYLEYMVGGGMGGGKKPQRSPEQEERFSQFREMMRPQAEASIKRMLVVETLADREGLRASHDDLDDRVEAMATQAGRQPGDVWLELEKSGQLQQLEAQVTEEKVLEWLRSQNTTG
ncbi:trigger factor [Longimicrobium sp.]|uniref:trigger factor n=1 Tax=Longimicrobium sp. TaxID=2029185 RepID=UPI002BC0CA08|nr:trigger factor [Longimicrobium sp.]HSU17190.1 trigger factor [Longimicrobium sp.]